MIKVRVVAVGKVKEEYYRAAIAEYSKRLSRYCDFSVVEVKEENFTKTDAAAIGKILSVEGERIAAAAKGYMIAMAVEGEKTTSEELAEFIKKLADDGIGEITFIIGGSYGIDEKIKRGCRKKISLSAMTFPHTLARVVLCEQIYRAFTIIAGAEYHK